jgi:hypothetical protein
MTLEISGQSGDTASGTAGTRATTADGYNTDETGLATFSANGSIDTAATVEKK